VTRPDIDDTFAVNDDRSRRAKLTALLEILDEGVADAGEARIAFTIDSYVCGHHGLLGDKLQFSPGLTPSRAEGGVTLHCRPHSTRSRHFFTAQHAAEFEASDWFFSSDNIAMKWADSRNRT